MRRTWDKYHLLNVFCQVIEKGSFSKAAEALNLPNSSISKSISQLESFLGKKLLVRTTRVHSLTDEGNLVFKHAQQLIEGFNTLEDELNELSNTAKGKLRITFPNTIGRMIFTDICNEFLKCYPHFELELIFTSTNLDLIEDRIDIAFRTWQTLPDSVFYSVNLINIHSVFVATPDYIDSYGTPLSIEQLQNHNVLVTHHSTVENTWIDEAGKKHILSGNLIANNRFHIREAVLAGLGVGMLPSYFCQKDITQGKLIELLPDLKRPHKTLGALYKVKRQSSKKLDTFMSFVESKLALI